ncbi:MAG TPA: A/G-specific adenine glycosylase [Terracidiphilus sp.]|nr:A/G-specific adenine glycosylase [Terracidiphilus sp.]
MAARNQASFRRDSLKLTSLKTERLRRRLLKWYDTNKRDLPWRGSHDPYAVWVSEIMLQQTRVAVVVERYQAFLKRFPSLVSLALAKEEEVLALWSGLGYYRRARMLHKAAQFVAQNYYGSLPRKSDELRELPGIGEYTAGAIASIAHGECVPVVDGNVERVICRLAGWDESAKQRRKVGELAARLVDPARPGDFNQAMMELGAVVCLPRGPRCTECPLSVGCTTRGEHRTQKRAPMKSVAVAHALSVRTSDRKAAHDRSGREVLLEQRPATVSVMPGMWELPQLLEAEVPPAELRMTVRHAIMQTNYYVRIRTVFEDDAAKLTAVQGERRWVSLSDAANIALTGLARKVLIRAHLLPTVPLDAIAPPQDGEIV